MSESKTSEAKKKRQNPIETQKELTTKLGLTPFGIPQGVNVAEDFEMQQKPKEPPVDLPKQVEELLSKFGNVKQEQ